MSARRMAGLGKLSDFGKTATHQAKSEAETQPVAEPGPQPVTVKQPKAVEKQEEKLVTVNIKIPRSQQEWLADTARLVRENNTTPVPPSDRVYPQHLIQVAVDLLESAKVDWTQIRNTEDLRELLGL